MIPALWGLFLILSQGIKPVAAQQSLGFNRLTTDHGLSHDEVHAALRLESGEMWIGSLLGLQSWNGETVLRSGFRATADGLPVDHVSALAVVTDGVLVGTKGGGIAILNNGERIHPIKPTPSCGTPAEAPSDIVGLASLPGDSVLVTGIFESPWLYTGETYCPARFAVVSDTALVRHVTATALDREGRLWLGTLSNGLLVTTIKGGVFSPMLPVGLPDSRIRDLAFDPNGVHLWVATSGSGVFRYNLTTQETVRVRDLAGRPLPEDRVFSIELGGGRLWIGMWEGGLASFDPVSNTLSTYRHSDSDPASLCHDLVGGLYLDDFGVLWALTDGGICGALVTTRDRMLPATGLVSSVSSEWDQGDLVISDDGGIFAVDIVRGSKTRVSQNPVLASGSRQPTVTALTVSQGKKYAGTGQHGVFLVHETERPSLVWPDLAVRALAPVRKGLAVATLSRGVELLAADGSMQVLMSDAHVRNVRAMVPGPDSTLWVASADGGVFSFSPGDSVSIVAGPWGDPERNRSIDRVDDLLFSPDGWLWAATAGGMIAYSPGADETVFHESGRGLPLGQINATTHHEPTGTLWAASEMAVSRFDAAGRTWDTFRPPPGIEDTRVLPRGLVSVGDHVVAALERGLWILDPLASPPGSPEPIAQIVTPSVTRSGNDLVLPRGATELDLKWSLADLARPKEVRLGAQLEQIEAVPTEHIGTVMTLEYRDLPSRSDPYTLRLTALSSSGDFSERTFRVFVRPLVWNTFWFRSLTASLIVVGVAGTVVSRTRRRRREAIEIQDALAESREDERRLIARHIHDGPIQTLSAVQHSIQLYREDDYEAGLDRAMRISDEVIVELRRICANLRPKNIGQVALERTVGAYCADFQVDHPDLTVIPDLEEVGDIPENVVVAVYRVLQSALGNVAKHAEASEVRVTLSKTSSHMVLTIADDGVGFERDTSMLALARGRHFGLLGMREWAERGGGTLAIQSEPGRGTSLTLQLPLPT